MGVGTGCSDVLRVILLATEWCCNTHAENVLLFISCVSVFRNYHLKYHPTIFHGTPLRKNFDETKTKKKVHRFAFNYLHIQMYTSLSY